MAPNKSNKSKRKSNNTLLFAIGIIAIILIGTGVFIVLGHSNQPANVSPTPTPTTAPTTFKVTPTPGPTATPPPSTSSAPSPTTTDPLYVNPTKVLLQTSAGNITLEMRSDKPITTANFEKLVRDGKYDGSTFHRTMAGFMIQGGIISGSTPTIPDEIGSNNRNIAYTIAMAKTAQPNSATSQFFINVADNGNNVIDQAGTKFDAVYTVFGKVILGQSVVNAIANAPVNNNQYTGEPSDPVNPVTIIKATIIP
jgi:cyclophilin family peptidyl-prolyl cis-trans isomerase